MKILVTGGAGFIGSHLVDKLLEKGHEVHVIDNLHDNYQVEVKLGNLSSARLSPRFTFHKTDICDRERMFEIFNEHQYNVVIHLAALAGVRNSIIQEELYYQVNVMGTRNVLECCRKSGVAKLIFASSSSVYGNNEKLPFREDDVVDFPVSPYAASKKACELMCYTYHHLYKMSVICLRFFTVYGPRQRPDLAIHKFSRLIMEDKKITMYGDGSSSRDYTYIDDTIAGILGAIRYLESGSCYEIINLGESRTISLLEMITALKRVFEREIKWVSGGNQPGDVKATYADIGKAQKLLNYEPKMEFEEGIRKFRDWIEKQPKNYIKK